MTRKPYEKPAVIEERPAGPAHMGTPDTLTSTGEGPAGPTPRHAIKITESLRKQLIADYEVMGLERLGKKYGISATTIRSRFVEWGVPPKRRGVPRECARLKMPHLDRVTMVRDFASGMTKTAIAGKHGCSISTVITVLRSDDEKDV